MMQSVGYIAYIDEAGDAGLRQIRTKVEGGASEWLVMSAVLVRAEREQEVTQWTRQMIASLDQHQVKHLHFRQIPELKRASVCRQLAGMDVRLFIFATNKRNMEGYRNLQAERAGVNKTAWFYAWCSKILLESVTDYCGRRSRKEHGMPRTVRLEFSQTGGVKLLDLRNYFQYIKEQASLGISFRKDFPLDWEVLDTSEIFVLPNAAKPGLQLADVAASAFFAGLEYTQQNALSPEYGKLLFPRICQDRRRKRCMYGFKFLPRSIISQLPGAQAELLNFYLNS